MTVNQTKARRRDNPEIPVRRACRQSVRQPQTCSPAPMMPSARCSLATARHSTTRPASKEDNRVPRKCINTNERLFGMEIEYGFSVRNRDAVRSFDWLDYFMTVARKQLPHLPSMDGGGIFLENGARLYVDSSHPEMTTPECANPWDVVRYMQAGDKMLTSIAEEMKNVMIFKTNVDHGGSGASWGCHTSFMHLGNSGRFPAQIIPHLVSRIIYSGAGGMEPLADGRLGFTLSPRVRFL